MIIKSDVAPVEFTSWAALERRAGWNPKPQLVDERMWESFGIGKEDELTGLVIENVPYHPHPVPPCRPTLHIVK